MHPTGGTEGTSRERGEETPSSVSGSTFTPYSEKTLISITISNPISLSVTKKIYHK